MRAAGPVRRSVVALLLILLVLSALRVLFWCIHGGRFPDADAASTASILVQGLRFDAMTLVWANAPFLVLALVPWPWRNQARFQFALRVLFIAANVLVLFLCCVDLPFYGFNGKRITRDLLGQADAAWRMADSFVVRYWWALLVMAVCVAVLKRISDLLRWQRGKEHVRADAIWGMVALAVIGLLSRGGWQYQGLSPAHAADHVPAACAPLVTNSAFTFAYSLTEPSITQRDWFTPEELDKVYPLRYTLAADSTDRKRNVVLLIVESLGREYLSTLSGEGAYMPFLDSLCARSLVLTDAYANAERSNKSMCAILAGIPSFTEDAFMNTAYGGNTVDGLGRRMKSMGYTTAFFHGGLNGEYKFDSFTKACGFDAYHGKDQFGDDKAYDGHWGIYDEEFLAYTAERLGGMQEPFCATVFTLSSHDPFPIPPKWKGHFPKGYQEIHESLGYADMSIRRFFEAAARTEWYANTVFVITGDHTFQYNDHPLWYRNPAGRFAVPILFFSPDGSFTGQDDRTAQHLDIVPSVLDLVGYEGPVYTFGQSVFKRDRPDRAFQMLGGQYQLIEGDRLIQFIGERVLASHDHLRDTLFVRDLSDSEPMRTRELELQLKAAIQRHAQALANNGLCGD